MKKSVIVLLWCLVAPTLPQQPVSTTAITTKGVVIDSHDG